MTDRGPKLFVVIPVFNRVKETLDCLASLAPQCSHWDKVVVVDDGSTDGTEAAVDEAFPDTVVLRTGGELWWTAATNVGIEYALKNGAENDLVLLLNNDLTVSDGYLAALRRSAGAAEKTLIGSVVVDRDDHDTILWGGIHINWVTAKRRLTNVKRSLQAFSADHLQESSTLTGRGTLIPLSVITAIGNYDDVHFQQCGDTELPLRALRAGFRIQVDYSCVVYSVATGTGSLSNATRSRYRVGALADYFFGIRSNARLRYRFWFARSGTQSLVAALWYFLWDTCRSAVHFLRRIG